MIAANSFGIKLEASAFKEGKTSGTISPLTNSEMDEEVMLQHHEALLVQELALVRAKLAYVRLTRSELKKGWSPCLTSTSNLVETTSFEPKEDISPSVKKQKSETSPSQTEEGKDSSNPLMADALPKSIKKDLTSNNLANEKIKDLINLRPNQGIQSPLIGVKSVEGNTSEGIPIPNSKSKPFYVVFNGPNRGIFENWELAKQATEGVSNIKHKKFRTFLEAKTAANQYCRDHLLDESSMRLICSSEGLRPANFAAALKAKKETKVSLGRLPQRNLPEIIENHENPSLDISGFEYLYKLSRLAGEEELLVDKYFTKDGKNLSYFNFIQGADPIFIADAFSYGLVKTIFPSQNLIEISLLPQKIYKSIKNFRTKVLKSDKEIFLKVLSTIPLWDEQGISYVPQHLIQICFGNDNKYSPSVPSPCSLDKTEFTKLGQQRFEEFFRRVFTFDGKDKIFVNSEDSLHLVYSKTNKNMSTQDQAKIVSFQQRLLQGTYLPAHDRRLCVVVEKIMESRCDKCQHTLQTLADEGPSTIKEDSSPTKNDKGKEIADEDR